MFSDRPLISSSANDGNQQAVSSIALYPLPYRSVVYRGSPICCTKKHILDQLEMIVQIENENDGTDKSDPPEWAMLELNGELVPPPPTATAEHMSARQSSKENDVNQSDKLLSDDSNRVELGAVKFTKEGTPMMILGSHELKGEVVVLKEPFCVMRKRKRNDDAVVEYSVVGIVTKKLLFNQYPKSIMR